MATEVLGFTTREMRDFQYDAWRREGSKGLICYTTYQGNDPAIVWVVTRSEPVQKVDSSDKKGQPDGQNSVHDNSGQPEHKTDISEGREPAPQLPDGSDHNEFRDWSA